ncbi:MAG: phage Gp19/Gp15/Gp42 family protein [Sphaerochaeta sp.]|nr:phage Gp19/Gp15/Gp42 family protein [Sphaerochaeta sp.]
MTYTVLTDVSTRLGRTISDAAEIAQVNAWISDIEGVIIERIPDLVALVTAGEIAAATVVRVECQAVLRKIKNPDGKKDERGDDYSYGLNPEYAKGELFLTDEEWASLATSTSETAFTIAPSGLRDADGDWTL